MECYLCLQSLKIAGVITLPRPNSYDYHWQENTRMNKQEILGNATHYIIVYQNVGHQKQYYAESYTMQLQNAQSSTINRMNSKTANRYRC